jgi:hypothetical protein
VRHVFAGALGRDCWRGFLYDGGVGVAGAGDIRHALRD